MLDKIPQDKLSRLTNNIVKVSWITLNNRMTCSGIRYDQDIVWEL